MEVMVARCAGLDVHKDSVMGCIRSPGADGKRAQEVRQFPTFTRSLVALREWLTAQGVTEVAMEATGVYWIPVWHILEEMPGVTLRLVNAQHVKNVPGRKTDVSDAAWLAQLLECGLLRGSFIPEPAMARLRDLTRYRKKLVDDRAKEVLRIQKLLETAGIKLDSVATDVVGKSSRRMLEALIAGERNPDVLAELALTRLRGKIPTLRLALEGRFTEHHALMARLHLDHIDYLSDCVERLDQQVEVETAPFEKQIELLRTIPGVGQRVAEVVIAEIGVDMSRFPTPGHLASWSGMCPGNNESAGKKRSGRARRGNQSLRTVLCEAAWAASHSKETYLAALFQRFRRRFGRKNGGDTKATFAVAHAILVIIWHVLATGRPYEELGYDYFDKRNENEAYKRRLIQQLEKLGLKVTVEEAA